MEASALPRPSDLTLGSWLSCLPSFSFSCWVARRISRTAMGLWLSGVQTLFWKILRHAFIIHLNISPSQPFPALPSPSQPFQALHSAFDCQASSKRLSKKIAGAVLQSLISSVPHSSRWTAWIFHEKTMGHHGSPWVTMGQVTLMAQHDPRIGQPPSMVQGSEASTALWENSELAISTSPSSCKTHTCTQCTQHWTAGPATGLHCAASPTRLPVQRLSALGRNMYKHIEKHVWTMWEPCHWQAR